jgi:hypothetical protein
MSRAGCNELSAIATIAVLMVVDHLLVKRS